MTHTLTARGYDASEDGTGRGTPLVAATLTSGSHNGRPPGRRQEDDTNIVVVDPLVARSSRGRPQTLTPGHNTDGHVVAFHMTQDPIHGSVSPALGENAAIGVTYKGVRRLIPTECCRIMGWPDDWTYDFGPSRVDAEQSWPSADRSPSELRPDGRRYSACGDGVVAHVAEWIGLGFPALTSGRISENEEGF